jgi:hypothetical protein
MFDAEDPGEQFVRNVLRGLCEFFCQKGKLDLARALYEEAESMRSMIKATRIVDGDLIIDEIPASGRKRKRERELVCSLWAWKQMFPDLVAPRTQEREQENG